MMETYISQIIQLCDALLAPDADPLTDLQRAHIHTVRERTQVFSRFLDTRASDHLMHDLRSLLSVVHSYGYLLREGAWGSMSATNTQYLDGIFEASRCLIEELDQMAIER